MFDRPGWNEMIRLAEVGTVKTVIVKDMSPMGRDYLKVRYYTDTSLWVCLLGRLFSFAGECCPQPWKNVLYCLCRM
uniref:hypothetical protein n=1 Tax=Luxibacter massiliensis TaxID=2219695 RepID=UPI000F053F95|nr:hypothetical protein [Luxibacter massiliensis]